MNLAIRGIDSSNVKWNNEGSFLNDAHKDVKADFIIANPPFNDSDWSGEQLTKDARWSYGLPPSGNANYAWIQHFIYHLAQNGQAGFVLSKGSLTSNSSNEGEIRKALIENDLIDCIVNLPAKLFLNTQIPACLWFLSKNKQRRKGKILFIDARNLGFLVNRRTKELTDDDIAKVASTYHNWKNGLNRDSNNGLNHDSSDLYDKNDLRKSETNNQGNHINQKNHSSDYEDIAGFCKAATVEEVKVLNYVVTPGRYVGLLDDEDDFNFAERFSNLKTELENQIAEEDELNKRIAKNLFKINLTADVEGN